MEIENNHCLMCKVERGTMEHCLFDCEMLQGFLDLVKTVVENSALDGHTLSRRDIIFGRYEVKNDPPNCQLSWKAALFPCRIKISLST